MYAKRLMKKVMNVETLETRVLLSTVFALHGKDLFVQGDNGPNSVVVTDSGNGQIQVRAENQPKWSSFSGVSRVVVRTGGGADSVLYRFSSNVTTPRAVDIDTGGGNDRVQFSADRAGLSFSSPVSLLGRCGAGDDACVVSLPAVQLHGDAASSSLFLKIELACGSGDDDCDGSVTLAPGSTGGVGVKVDAGAGDDRLSVASSPSSTAAGAAAVDFFLKLDLRGNSGIDSIDVDAVCPDGSCASSVRVDGGTGDDAISSRVSVSPPSSAQAASSTDIFIKVQLLGGDGADQVSSELSVASTCVGGVQSSASGGAGDDEIFIKMPSSSSAFGDGSVRYFLKLDAVGGQGNDQLATDLALSPGGASPNLVSLDGGTGSDTLSCMVAGQSSLPRAPDGTPGLAALGTFLKIRLLGAAGNDDVSAEMTIAPGQLGEIDCVMDGGAGDDVLACTRADVAPPDATGGGGAGGSSRAFDTFLKLDCVGGAGSDRLSTNMSIAPGCAATNALALDGGADDDALFLKLESLSLNGLPPGTPFSFIKIDLVGGTGQDDVSADMTIAPSSASGLDATCDGGSGDDSLRVLLHGGQDPATPAFVLVDGGGGVDSASVSSNVMVFDVVDVHVIDSVM